MREQIIDPSEWQHMIGTKEYYLPDGERCVVEKVEDNGMASARRTSGEWAGQTVLVAVTTLSEVPPENA